MNFKFQYKNETDRNEIIEKNSDKYLIEEQNLFEGNFLVFSDIKPLEFIVEEMDKNQRHDSLITFEALATIYEEVMSKGWYNMVEMYVRLVQEGRRTIEQVPEKFRDDVRSIVENEQ